MKARKQDEAFKRVASSFLLTEMKPCHCNKCQNHSGHVANRTYASFESGIVEKLTTETIARQNSEEKSREQNEYHMTGNSDHQNQ